jgi:hypothetical protein
MAKQATQDETQASEQAPDQATPIGTVRSQIYFQLDIDGDAWQDLGGLRGVRAVQRDVKAQVEKLVRDTLAERGLLAG